MPDAAEVLLADEDRVLVALLLLAAAMGTAMCSWNKEVRRNITKGPFIDAPA